MNLLTCTDGYKPSHDLMRDPKIEKIYGYLEARKGAKYEHTCFFGLRPIIAALANGVTKEDVLEMKRLSSLYTDPGAFSEEGWNEVLDVHGGNIPLEIRAVPEGSCVDPGNVLLTVVNTGGPKTAFLTNYFDPLLTQVWGPSTVASLSLAMKRLCKRALEKTTDDEVIPFALPFMLHDFGYRGASTTCSAAILGMGHLVHFLGTDTIPALSAAEHYYCEECAGFTIPASEHSVMTSEGRDGELTVMKRMLDVYPTGTIAWVIDSYDDEAFILGLAASLRERIKNRPPRLDPDGNVITPGRVVFRPDTGDPVRKTLEVLRNLETVFGYTRNKKGYKVLHDSVRMIWGDGITPSKAAEVLQAITEQGWSAENICFGMGGALLQGVGRDDQRFAFKASAIYRNRNWKDVYKCPNSDKSKASKGGRFSVYRQPNSGKYETLRFGELDPNFDQLKLVFRDGVLYNQDCFETIRARASRDLSTMR